MQNICLKLTFVPLNSLVKFEPSLFYPNANHVYTNKGQVILLSRHPIVLFFKLCCSILYVQACALFISVYIFQNEALKFFYFNQKEGLFLRFHALQLVLVFFNSHTAANLDCDIKFDSFLRYTKMSFNFLVAVLDSAYLYFTFNTTVCYFIAYYTGVGSTSPPKNLYRRGNHYFPAVIFPPGYTIPPLYSRQGAFSRQGKLPCLPARQLYKKQLSKHKLCIY